MVFFLFQSFLYYETLYVTQHYSPFSILSLRPASATAREKQVEQLIRQSKQKQTRNLILEKGNKQRKMPDRLLKIESKFTS